MNEQRQIDRVASDFASFVVAPLYYLIGVGVYVYAGWTGVIVACVFSVVFAFLRLGWFIWRTDRKIRRRIGA